MADVPPSGSTVVALNPDEWIGMPYVDGPTGERRLFTRADFSDYQAIRATHDQDGYPVPDGWEICDDVIAGE